MKMRTLISLLLSAMLAAGTGVAAAAHDEGGHTGHSGGHKGKGPKYQGGDHGSGHSSQAHKGGSHHHDGDSGGSKAMENKVFKGHGGKKGSGHEGTEHSH